MSPTKTKSDRRVMIPEKEEHVERGVKMVKDTKRNLKKSGSRGQLSSTLNNTGKMHHKSSTNIHGDMGSSTDKLKSPTGGSPSRTTATLLTTVVDVEYIPLIVDMCYWVAEQTETVIEIEQFITCLQDGIVLCRLANALGKIKCEKTGEPFKPVHFKGNIGSSVFHARINIETFIRWSKSLGVTDTCTVGDLVDLKDVMQALNNINSVGRKCADIGLPNPRIVDLELKHGMRYQDLIALFDPAYGKASFEEKAAKDDFIDLMNERGLGALRNDALLSEQLGGWRKKLAGRMAGNDVPPPIPSPRPPTPPVTPPKAVMEAKMGPWDNEEVSYLISLYKHQIEEFGDDHIDFQLLSKNYTRKFSHRTPHQCWDKMYQLIERYKCDRSANRLFKRKVSSGPHHDKLHICLGDTDISKHLNAVYTGMVHPKVPVIPTYVECDGEEKTDAEKSGKEQIAEQTVFLKSINDTLKAIKEQVERNTTTNAALLVLMTHVLKGDALENEVEAESVPIPPATQEAAEGNGIADNDSKSIGSDIDIFDKRSENC